MAWVKLEKMDSLNCVKLLWYIIFFFFKLGRDEWNAYILCLGMYLIYYVWDRLPAFFISANIFINWASPLLRYLDYHVIPIQNRLLLCWERFTTTWMALPHHLGQLAKQNANLLSRSLDGAIPFVKWASVIEIRHSFCNLSCKEDCFALSRSYGLFYLAWNLTGTCLSIFRVIATLCHSVTMQRK